MQLHSLRIKQCFGFQDSGHINLVDPGNLVYVLGKNSSGKTALLTAIANLSMNIVPKDNERFENFNTFDEQPSLIAKYKGDFLFIPTQHLNAVFSYFKEINNSISQAFKSETFLQLTNDIFKVVNEEYDHFLVELSLSEEIWVKKDKNGDYQISTNEGFYDVSKRIQTLQKRIDAVINNHRASGAMDQDMIRIDQTLVKLQLFTAQHVENYLFLQFPQIIWFDKSYKLSDSIPDHIKKEHLEASNGIIDAFITVLNRETLERFLWIINPIQRRQLLSEMQNHINTILADVNGDFKLDNKAKLLDIILDSHEGLQVTVVSGTRTSYYRHISDNTKFLFAYYLYLHAHGIQSNVILFDEPDNGFHASAQEELLKFMKMLAARDNQIIVSTHSQHLIDIDHLTGIRLMDTDDSGDYLAVRNKWNDLTLEKGSYLALRPVSDAIGLRYGANHLSIQNSVIITEGPSELLYVQALRQLLHIEENIHIAPANGDKVIPHVIALIISQGLNFKVIVDTKTHGKSAKSLIQEGYLIPNESIFEIGIPSNFSGAKGSGIEDIFSKRDFFSILTSLGSTPSVGFATMSNSQYMNIKGDGYIPKLVVAREFRKNISNYKVDDFEEETLRNIREIIEFCLNDAWFRF